MFSLALIRRSPLRSVLLLTRAVQIAQIAVHTLLPRLANYKDASDIKMCIGICLGDTYYIHTQTMHNKYSLIIDHSDLNNEHVVQLTQALADRSAPTHS